LVEETVLVTGGCGFVGRRTVAVLKGAGHSVRVLDIPRADFSGVIDLGAKPFEGSVVDAETVQVALGNARVVYHMAAPAMAIHDARFIRKMVVAGTEVLMEEAEDSRVEHVVAASTTGVYARTRGVHGEDAPLRPGNHLERAKLDMERALERGARRTGVGVTVLRLANVYGAGDEGLVDRLVPRVARGEGVTLPDRGFVNTVHVEDVVDAARRLAAMAREADGEDGEDGEEWEDGEDGGAFRVWNCVDDGALSPRELLDAVARVTGSPAPALRRPGLLGRSKGRWADRRHCIRLVERGRYSNEAIKGALPGWPRWATFEQGLPGEL
jgi:nucleoside-diphosphate-sugar epimerase